MENKIPEVFEDVRKIFSTYLETNAHRKTPERFVILHEIYTCEGHFNIESLLLKMKGSNYNVSRATLYNTIELLVKCGLVLRHQFGQNNSIYEKSYKFKQHDHLICVDTKEMFEFCDPRIQEIQKSLEAMFHVKITHHSLNFYGYKNSEQNNK
jgi:Fur family transcriptional regulator, ferric uptake regulator